MRASWLRSSFFPASHATLPAARFDTTQAVAISSSDELTALNPAFLKTLCAELEVQSLAGRLCPVLMADHSVAIFSLMEHVGSDQADELARRVRQEGYTLATPQRYILAAPLLLAIARNQVTAQSLVNERGIVHEQSKTALADAFQDMVEWGVRHGASDLHLNVRLREPESEVKYTLSGRYVAPERFSRMPTSTLIDMISVAWMDIRGGNGAVFDPLVEQQGQMIKRVEGKTILLRWASLAADQGPSVCLRILNRDSVSSFLSLAQLGYLPHQVNAIERSMLSAGGAIVFAGTVGSGKSTTLASLVAGISTDRKIITIEDPVEYLIPRAIQNTVTRDLDTMAHDAYAAKLRALKRSAMNDVLLGEIRDEETGRAFMDLAGSGVNVYTTVHAPSAALVAQRLASDFIGVSRDFLATPGVLKLLVYQVLLPTLCRHCAVPVFSSAGARGPHGPARPDSEWRIWLNRIERLYACGAESMRIRNPLGCSFCQNNQVPDLYGYAGRTVAAEYIEPALSTGFLESIRHAGSLDYSHRYNATVSSVHGIMPVTETAIQCAIHKALQGEIDPRDIEPRFQSFETVERQQNLLRQASQAAV